MSRRLTADQRLVVRIDATLSRESFTLDPGPVLAAVLKLAGDRTDILADACGAWVGSHEHLPECAPLVEAIRPYAGSESAARAQHARRNPHGGDVGR